MHEEKGGRKDQKAYRDLPAGLLFCVCNLALVDDDGIPRRALAQGPVNGL